MRDARCGGRTKDPLAPPDVRAAKSGEVSRFAGCSDAPAAAAGGAPPISTFASVANTMPVTCAIVPRCVVMQPFGRPVVPEV